jgi:hypothetical protein
MVYGKVVFGMMVYLMENGYKMIFKNKYIDYDKEME